jgi:uncharacterized membrane protein
MNAISRFIVNTITGGILLLVPLVLLVVIFGKLNSYLLVISEPLAKKLEDGVLGFDGSKLIAIVLLILICFICGLLFRSNLVRKMVVKLEESVLCYVPGYSMIKALTSDAVGATQEHNMKSILLKDGESWMLGFLVEESEGLCTVFLPEAPSHDSGEVRIVPAEMVLKIAVPSNKFALSIKNYGKGAIQWIEKK